MSLDLPGFADPGAEAQATFRAVLDALAHPGRIVPAGAGLTPPDCLHPATAAVLLTLADDSTRLWLAPDFADARDWLAFHCGAPFAATPAQAVFGVEAALPDLSAYPPGTAEVPEASATIIVQVAALGTGAAFTLAGPGLRTPETFRATGLPANFAAIWAASHAQYPCGIDLILCCGTHLAALPRSVAVTEG